MYSVTQSWNEIVILFSIFIKTPSLLLIKACILSGHPNDFDPKRPIILKAVVLILCR